MLKKDDVMSGVTQNATRREGRWTGVRGATCSAETCGREELDEAAWNGVV